MTNSLPMAPGKGSKKKCTERHFHKTQQHWISSDEFEGDGHVVRRNASIDPPVLSSGGVILPYEKNTECEVMQNKPR